MKKLFGLLVTFALVVTLTACGGKDDTDTSATDETTGGNNTVVIDESGFDVAMITDAGTIDDESFNQGTWEGIVEFCTANNITHKYYKPIDVSDDDYLDAIELAISNGAEVVVTPGYLFESSIYEAQADYPDVKFILIDGVPHTPDYSVFETLDNTLPILFNEHESGFLAGYAAVKDGYTELGFMGGMAVPAVVKFGIGYIAGAYYAAEEDNVTISFDNDTYHYLGNFGPSDDHKTMAQAWYTSGTEVIFTAAGGAGSSVMTAAEIEEGKVIGVDIDQANSSDTVITSALKQLANAVQQALTDWNDGNFVGGTAITKGAVNDGVGLPMGTSIFTTFDETMYDAIYEDLVDETVVVPANWADLQAFFTANGLTLTDNFTEVVVTPPSE